MGDFTPRVVVAQNVEPRARICASQKILDDRLTIFMLAIDFLMTPDVRDAAAPSRARRFRSRRMPQMRIGALLLARKSI